MRAARAAVPIVLVALGLAWAPAAPLWAAPEAAWTLTPEHPRVGDRITARLTVALPPGTAVDWDAVAPAFEGLDPAGAVPAPVGPDGAEARDFALYADLPGTYRLPEVALGWRGPDGASGTVHARPVDLTVTGAFDPAGPAPPPAPAKPPVGLPLPPWVYGAAALAALVAVAAAWGLYRRFRRRGRRPVPAPPTPTPVPAHERALMRLAALDPAALSSRAFYDALSDVARAYLEERFGLPARRRTTGETHRLLAALKPDAEGPMVAPVSDWLVVWDMVKFARVEPPAGYARAHLEAVRRWVTATAAPGR